MTGIERTRKSRPPNKWLGWIWIINGAVFFITMILYIVDKSYGRAIVYGYISALHVTWSILFYQNLSQDRLNRELIQELDRLKYHVKGAQGNVAQTITTETQRDEAKN